MNGNPTPDPTMVQRPARPDPTVSSGAVTDSLQSFMLAVARHWTWILLATVAGAMLGYHLGQKLWSHDYVATAQLIVRQESPDPRVFQTRPVSAQTLAGIISSPEVRRRAGKHARPSLTAAEIGDLVEIKPERNNDIVRVSVVQPDLSGAVALANAYVEEAVEFTREMQAGEAGQATHYLEQQLKNVEEEISIVEDRLSSMPMSGLQEGIVMSRPSALTTRLSDARDELAELFGRYTDAHPRVQEQRARIEVLEKLLAELNSGAGGAAGMAGGAAGIRDAGLLDILKILESQRISLVERIQVAHMLEQTPAGFFRVFERATEDLAEEQQPTLKIGLLVVVAAVFSTCLMVGICMLVELFDRRLKTVEDVRRVTQLPVLATLGRFRRKLPPATRAQWAFRTWTALHYRISGSSNQGLVCGFTSSGSGEGRSLWVEMLAEAANQCGYRVLTITTQASPTVKESKPVGGTTSKNRSVPAREGDHTDLNVLASPSEIARKVADASSPPVVRIPLPGWVWNLERRKEWLAALRHWSSIDNLVILVELPPASSTETVLLAQNLPNLVWLVDSSQAEAPETRTQLETLRQARCNLVGAVINRAPPAFASGRFARWLPRLAVAMLMGAVMPGFPGELGAQPDNNQFPQIENTSSTALSASAPAKRAQWQERLVLGAGDVLRLALYGEPELTREDVVVQPDGRISYLEVQGLMAAGLTVDELRTALDDELSFYRRAARTMVVPQQFNSRKYYMLGKISQTGAFTLDRPLTVLEAVARANGFETGLSGRNVVEMVDLSRSFLMRNGTRAEVDFRKLFGAGSLAENIPVEPGDYFYFPPNDLQEIHVLGEVDMPGSVTFSTGLTAVRAIASSGGFTRRAWQKNLLVLRGSLGDPELITLNIPAVLAGKEPDLELQPRDIVYVSERRWIRAEELLDDVFSAFTKSVIVYWVSDDVFPAVR